MEDTQALILSELRSLREDFNSYARESGERIATLETDMHSLVGNGQPGRVASLEDAVRKLSQWRWWVVGCTAGCTAVVSVLAWFIK
jgi:hypothetical protein